MWSYDGRTFDPPTFELGIISPPDACIPPSPISGTSLSSLLAHGKTANGEVLKPETLSAMWKPQFPRSGGDVFGLGFELETLDKHRMIGHDGAIYGFATTLDVLPEDNVGVIAVTTKDAANAVTEPSRKKRYD